MRFDEVQEKVHHALNRLIEKDAYLLENNVCERAIGHRLAVWLEESFQGWKVDCEYNREYLDGENGDRVQGKCVYLLEKRIRDGGFQSLASPESISVFPDIIVHKRGSGANLLAIEVKISSDIDEVDFDMMKLNAYREDARLHYEYSLFLRFTHSPNHNYVDADLSKWVKVGENGDIPFIPNEPTS